MIIKNLLVYGEDYRFHPGELCFDGDRLCDCSGRDDAVIDGEGAYAIPGLTDIHFHGCAGHDFCEGTLEAIEIIAGYEASQGVTQICPATLTLPEDVLSRVCTAAAEYTSKYDAADAAYGSALCGINMEGPFVSKAKKGAQNEAYIRRADAALFRRLQKLSGNLIKLVDLAPEEEGAMEFIDSVKDSVIISIAHTTADYDTAMEAFKRGASHVTHLYNAMPPFTHRSPGVIGAAFDTPDCHVELICDGVHINPAVVRATFKLFGEERIIMISDSLMAAGMPDGEYALGGQEVKVAGHLATLKDGTLAGSVTSLMGCVRSAVDMGIPLEVAIRCAAVNPARRIGIFKDYGSLSEGKKANFVLLNRDLSVKAVFINGRQIRN